MTTIMIFFVIILYLLISMDIKTPDTDIKIKKTESKVRKVRELPPPVIEIPHHGEMPKFDPVIEDIEQDKLDGLLKLLVSSQQVWIVGGQGSGKSTLLAWLADEYSKVENLFIVDSHNEPGKWPETAKIIGTGKNYMEIYAGLRYITHEIGKRIAALGNGEKRQNDFAPIRVLIDEYTMIPRIIEKISKQRKIENIMTDFRDSLFTEGRKVRIHPCFATHSQRAASVGFKGAMDIFQEINHKVFLRNINGDRFAEIQFGGEKEMLKYAVTGPHPRLEGIKSGEIVVKKKPVRSKSTGNTSDPTIGGMRCDPPPSHGQVAGANSADRISV